MPLLPALRQALKPERCGRRTPGLQDRIELDATRPATRLVACGNALTCWAMKTSDWVKHFDKQWCRDSAAGEAAPRGWNVCAHAPGAAGFHRSRTVRLSWWSWPASKRRLDPDADVRALYGLGAAPVRAA